HYARPRESYTLSLHDALPIFRGCGPGQLDAAAELERLCIGPRHRASGANLPGYLLVLAELDADAVEGERVVRDEHLSEIVMNSRSEEHTSELQSRFDLVCHLL